MKHKFNKIIKASMVLILIYSTALGGLFKNKENEVTKDKKEIIEPENIQDTENSLENLKEITDEKTLELFDLLFSESKTYYVEALIAEHFQDTSEVKYCLDRTLEIVANISELDSLTILQQDDFNRFSDKLGYDFRTVFSFLNGDSGNYHLASIREEISETLIDTVNIGDEKLIIIDDRPGHFPLVTSPQIERIIEFFQTSQRKNFQQWLFNSGKYKELMLPILREYGIPDEIFYLALIESGFKPSAYSYAHAAGTWQFIASTGARYGLTRNWWLDERRDPIKSTKAAAEYLSDLYEDFDDWFLALSAYNCGKLNVLRAIRREGTRDYWKLRTLPRQTRNYIPTLMAGIRIAIDPEKYGFEKIPIKTWEWDEVELTRCFELESIASISGVSANTLKEYNPELRRWMTPPDEKNYILRVPKGKHKGLLEKLEKLPEHDNRPKFVIHKVRRGQNLGYIARKYGTSVSAIVTANDIRNRNRVSIGQSLRIPQRNYYSTNYTQSAKGESITHIVRRGETLYDISRKYNVSLNAIRSRNNLYGKRYIYPRQKLIIPTNGAKATPQPPNGKDRIVHIVKKGETLSEIAELYHVGLSKVRNWNRIYGNRFIRPGQKIYIYKSSGS